MAYESTETEKKEGCGLECPHGSSCFIRCQLGDAPQALSPVLVPGTDLWLHVRDLPNAPNHLKKHPVRCKWSNWSFGIIFGHERKTPGLHKPDSAEASPK